MLTMAQGPPFSLEPGKLMNGREMFLVGFQAVPEHFPAEHASLRPCRLVELIRLVHGGQEVLGHSHRGLAGFP